MMYKKIFLIAVMFFWCYASYKFSDNTRQNMILEAVNLSDSIEKRFSVCCTEKSCQDYLKVNALIAKLLNPAFRPIGNLDEVLSKIEISDELENMKNMIYNINITKVKYRNINCCATP